MTDAAAYNIVIRKGEFEGEICFEARVTEFPDIAEYADSYEEAYALAIDTIEVSAIALAEQGKPMPAPYIPADDFSGRVTLRIPKTLHRSLAQTADAEDVSLNQHLVNILSYYSGYANAMEHGVWREAAIPPQKKANNVLPFTVINSKNIDADPEYAQR